MATEASGNSLVVSAFFNDRSDAELAMDELAATGISNDDVALTCGDEDSATAKDHMGFWDALTNLTGRDGQEGPRAEGSRRQGYLVTVRCSDDRQHNMALDILRQRGSIDLDEHAGIRDSEGRTH